MQPPNSANSYTRPWTYFTSFGEQNHCLRAKFTRRDPCPLVAEGSNRSLKPSKSSFAASHSSVPSLRCASISESRHIEHLAREDCSMLVNLLSTASGDEQ